MFPTCPREIAIYDPGRILLRGEPGESKVDDCRRAVQKPENRRPVPREACVRLLVSMNQILTPMCDMQCTYRGQIVTQLMHQYDLSPSLFLWFIMDHECNASSRNDACSGAGASGGGRSLSEHNKCMMIDCKAPYAARDYTKIPSSASGKALHELLLLPAANSCLSRWR
jgi:hypothetical protein